MRKEQGTITTWKDGKGFGFITPELVGKQIFVHIKEFSKKYQRPIEGLLVDYVISQDSSGRPCAVQVSPVSGHERSSVSLRRAIPSIILAGLFFTFVGWLVLLNKLSVQSLYTYVALSLFTFAMYANDKVAAKAGRWRISEYKLHVFELVGGWPGAMIAQSALRHKSKKQSFRFVYWLMVIANCYFLYWIVTDKGTVRFHTIFTEFWNI